MHHKALLLALALCTAAVGQAQIVTVNYSVRINTVFDYTTLSYSSITPIAASGWLTFDLGTCSPIDYGSTTITYFSFWNGAKWHTPLTPLIPKDPWVGAPYGDINDSYAVSSTIDSPSGFIEEFGAHANAYRSDPFGHNAEYHVVLRADRESPARNGDGTSDFPFTPLTALQLLDYFVSSGAPVYFEEFFSEYTKNSGEPVYSSGMDWADYSARITSYTVTPTAAAAVPEPSTFGLLAAVAALCLVARRRLNLAMIPYSRASHTH